jgi:predicted RNase H-like nuclease
MAVVAGVDGCPSEWLCVAKDLGSGTTVGRILAHIGDALTLIPRSLVLTIDVPIGLTDAGPRDCDREARAKLGVPRSSSIFPAPIRPTLKATDYLDACHLGVKADGRKLSRQTWAILGKIREVDTFLRSDPARQEWVREVHPEICFWAWNGNRAMSHRKKSPAGKVEREALVMLRYAEAYAVAKSTLPRGQYSNDDLLDAFAASWTAERVHAGIALVIPACPPIDSCGLRMEMVA